MSPSAIVAIAGLVVRVGAVGPGGDDGELDRVVAVGEQELGEVGGDVRLRTAGEPDLADVAVGRVRGGAGRREQLELARRP